MLFKKVCIATTNKGQLSNKCAAIKQTSTKTFKLVTIVTSKFREFMSPAIIVYYLNEIMTKTSVKFQKNRHKTVGGVAHTRYPVSINFDSKNARKMPKLK